MKREAITEKELKIIRSAIGKIQYADYVYAQCSLGLRPGEFLTLKKSDLQTVGGQLVLICGSGTDTGRDRCAPVPEAVREIIDMRLRQTGTDLLFPRLDIQHDCVLGWKPMTTAYYSKYVFKPLLKKLSIAEDKAPYCAHYT